MNHNLTCLWTPVYRNRILFFIVCLIVLIPFSISGKGLTSTQIKNVKKQIRLEKDTNTLSRLYILLIDSASKKNNKKTELKYRNQLHNKLVKAGNLKDIHYANLYKIGILYYQTHSLKKASTSFETLLKILPLSKVKLRNRTLQHLSAISEKRGRHTLEEKYLALYVLALAKVSDFYVTSGGFEKLLQLAALTGSKKEHTYFKHWIESANQYGSKKDIKMVLTRWVNFSSKTPKTFSSKPFESLITFYKSENLVKELQELRLLYAQSTQDEKVKLAVYQEIHQQNKLLEKPTDLGILTRLYKAYQKDKNQKGEQEILEALAKRNDYKGRREALKQLALLSLTNKDWLKSLKTHQELFKLTSVQTDKTTVIVLDNLISIAQKLSKEDLVFDYLSLKALSDSPFIKDTAKYNAFSMAMESSAKNHEFDKSIKLYQQILKTNLLSGPFPQKHEIHFLGARTFEQKEDHKAALQLYRLSFDTLQKNKKPDWNQAAKIARKLLQMIELYSPGEQEITLLKQIRQIHQHRKSRSDQARTELIIAQKLEKAEKPKEAVTYYKYALKSYKKDKNNDMTNRLLTLLSNLEEGSSETKLARLKELEKTQEKAGQHQKLMTTRIEIGNFYHSQKKSQNAIEYYLKGMNTDGARNTIKSIEAGYIAGLLLSETSDAKQADKVFKTLLKKKLRNKHKDLYSKIYQAHAKNLNSQNHPSQALKQIQLGLKLGVQQRKSSLIHTKAHILLSDNQNSKAESLLKKHLKTLKSNKEKPALLILLAQSQLNGQTLTAALKTLDQALKFNKEKTTPELFEILKLKSYTLNLKNDFQGAISGQNQLIERLEQSNEKSRLGTAYQQLTKYYIQAGQLSEAFDSNKQAQLLLTGQPHNQLRVLLAFARISQKQGKFKNCFEYFNKFQKHPFSTSSKSLTAEMHYQRGTAYMQTANFDLALKDFRRSETIFKELNQSDSAVQARMAQANVFMKLGKMDNAEKIFLSLLTPINGISPLKVFSAKKTQKITYKGLKARFKNDGQKGDIYNSLAFLNAELGRYQKALNLSQKAGKAYKKAGQQNRIPEVLNAKGLIFLKMGDFDQAEITFHKASSTNKSFNNPLLDSEISNNLGGLYKSKGDLEKAKDQLIRTAELQKKLGFESLLALTYNNIGSVYIEWKKYEEALSFLKQSRTFSLKFNLKKELAVSWNNEGILHFKQEKFQAAKTAFKEAIKLQEELELKIDLARSLNNLSIIASKENDLEKALNLVQNAVQTLSLDPLSKSRFFPNPDQKKILAPNLMKDFLQNKGSFLKELADQAKTDEKTATLLEASYHSFALSTELIESIRAQIKGEESQQLLMQTNINIYQQLITILYKLGKKVPGKGFHEKAFYYSEMSRARSFLDKLQEQAARSSLKLPENVRMRENDFKNQISFLDKNIFTELTKSSKERDEAKIKQWQLEKTELQLTYKKFTVDLEKKFPAYASLKYPKVYDVKMARDNLLSDTTQAVTFFLGTDISYGWILGSNVFKMIELPPNADIDRLIRKYRKTLVDPLIYEDEEDDEIVIDSTQSHLVTGLQIYRTILDPLLKYSDSTIKQLLFIPDGVLYYLPFETVLVQIHSQANKTFTKGREYLIHRYSVHYSPSISVLGMIKNQVKNRDPKIMAKRKDFVGFGDPQYAPNKKQAKTFVYNPALKQHGFYKLSRLIDTKKEINKISSIFNKSNQIFLREKAKESAVKTKIANYKYIHFATHGILDERNPEFSGIVLDLIQNDKPEDGFLQASEVFDLKINPDLVVLSACETGLGKVIKGEGMVGLTRAFMFAGTPSIVVSLWTVADDSTAKLMIHLYEFLKKGYSKDEALRKARIALMQESDMGDLIYNDPFFWGPFILNGTGI